MPLSEADAITIRDTFDTLPDDAKPLASDWLKRYKDQQDEFGLPLFPSDSAKAEEDQRQFFGMFDDLKSVDAGNGIYEQAERLKAGDGDRLRMREAGMRFLARQFPNVSPDVVRRDFPLYRDDFAMKAGGKRDMGDGEFYAFAKEQVMKQREAQDLRTRSLDAGFRAAIENAGSLEAFAKVAATAGDADKTEVDPSAFLESYSVATATLNKHRGLVREILDGVKSSMDGGEVDLEPLKEKLLDLPGTERRMVLASLRMQAEKAGESVKDAKGGKMSLTAGKFLQQVGESAGRLIGSASIDAANAERIIESIPEAGEVMAKGEIKTPEDARRYVREAVSRETSFQLSATMAGPGGVGAAPVEDRQPVKIGDEAKGWIQDAKEREKKRLRLNNEIRTIGEAADPVPNVFASTIGTSGAALLLMAGTRGLAAPALANAYTNIEYNDLSLKYPTMSREDKAGISALSGAAQAALDFVGVKALDKLPGIKSLISQPLTKQLAGRALSRGASSYAAENVVEAAQDLATPAIMGALKSDVPGFDWDSEMRDFWKGRADVAVGLLPLTLLGMGVASVNEYRGAKQLLTWNDKLASAGVVESDRMQIIETAQRGEVERAQTMLISAWGRRDPAVAAEYQDILSARDSQQQAAVADLERLGALPTIRRDGDGWTVRQGETVAKFATWDEARAVATQSMNDAEAAQIELVASLADGFLASTPSFLKGEAVEFVPRSESLLDRVNAGALTPESAMEAAIAGGIIKGVTLTEARGLAAEVFGGATPSERAMQFRADVEKIAVLGRNVVTGGESRSVVNAAGNEKAFLTAVEEVVEGRWKGGLERRAFTREQGVRFVQLAEAATGETFLEGSTWDEVNGSGELAPRALTEAISRVVVADVFGRMKDGKRIGPGSVTSGLNLNDREQSAFALILDTFRRLFRALLETAAKLAKARAEGKLGGEYDALFDALTGGSSQIEHEAGAAKEAEAIIDTSGYSEANPGPNGETFSIGRVKNGGRLLTFEKPIETPLGRVVSYEWQSDVIEDVDKDGEAVLKRVSDWDKAVANAETGRAIVHHFAVIQPDGSEKIVSLESALKATKGTETGKALNAAVKAARRLPLREAELAELEKLQADYDAAIQEATSQGWRNAPEPELRMPEFQPLAERGVKAVYVGSQFIKNLEPNELGSFGYKPSETEWKKQWAVGQLQRPPYGMGDRIQMLRRLIKKDKALIDGASLFSSRAIPADASKVVQMPDGARLVGPTTFSIRAYHGTPHKVDKFSTSKIGTGEGAQAYGWGLYFAESEGVAKSYRDVASRREGQLRYDWEDEVIQFIRSKGQKAESYEGPGTLLDRAKKLGYEVGNLYTVELLPDVDKFLDWDKPLSEQSEKVKAALPASWAKGYADKKGSEIYGLIAEKPWNFDNGYIPGTATRSARAAERASKYLASKGIPGIRYLDGGSRGAGDGTRNYVIFDENLVRILEENGKPVPQETFSLAARDAEYMAAVEAGDMEKVQRMVDEAANNAGYNAEGYHGTKNKIVEFLREKIKSRFPYSFGFHFTSRKTEAAIYATSVARFHDANRKGLLPVMVDGETIIHARLKYSNPLIVDAGPHSTASTKADLDRYEIMDKLLKAREAGSPFDAVVIERVKGDEWDGNNIIVFDPSQIKSADPVTRDDAGNVIPLSRRFNPADNRITYSIGSGDFASRMENRFALFEAKPELRLAVAQVAKQRALRLGAEWIEKAAVLRTSASIQKEQRFREADGFDRRVNAYLDSLTPSARQELEFEPASLENDPLVAAMLDFGKLMSQSTAKKQGKVEAKSGDYDGAPWLPPAWYSKGAGIMPDQMAQAMHDAGLLPDAYTGTLWDALASRIESTRKNKEAHREAVQAYQEAKKAAKVDARLEAEAWANQTRKQAGSAKAQREMLKAALRTLDGILAAAPAVVRARVGGYVKMAGLATDEAMLAEIEKRIDKLNVELEKWLKKEAVAEIRKLLKRGRPDASSGKKAQGKDADMHALFAAAEAAAEMDALAVAGRLAELDARIASGELTPEQEAMATTERGLVELIGDLDNADAGRAYSALETLQDIYQGGWLKWKLAEIERKERRAGLRKDFQDATGKTGVGKERDAADKRAKTMLGMAKAKWLSLSSFGDVLRYNFGEGPLTDSLIDGERGSSNRYEDANQALADEVEELFTSIAGSRLAGERLRFDMAQKSIITDKRDLSQLEAIQALLMWRQEDGRKHMEGTRNEDGKVTSKWSYDQAWIDEVDSKLIPEARRVMGWLVMKYGSEYEALNALYRMRYGVNMPRHDNYAPVTVKPMTTKAGEVVDPVTGATTSSGSILTPGSLRTRSRSAIAEPDFRDALQTFLGHSRQLEFWKAYYDLAVEANAVLGNREVMNAVHAKGGPEAASTLRQWIDAIAQGGFRDASARLALMQGVGRLVGRASGVALLGRISAVLVQSTQLAAASVQMPVTAYLSRFARLFTGGISWGDAIRSDFIQRRFKTAPPIVRQAMDNLATAKPNAVMGATRFLGNVLSGADALFTAGTYAMLLDFHRSQGAASGLSGAELEAYATSEAERGTEQVAQPTRMTNRSLAELTNTSPLARIGWAFASESRQKVALAGWALANAGQDPARAMKAVVLTFFVGGLLSQVLKNALRELKGDDDKNLWSVDRLAYAATVAPLVSAFPLGSVALGDANMLSNLKRAVFALDDGELDMREVDTILSAAGLFNDTAAGLAQLSHLGLDAAKIIQNLAE